MTDCNERAGRYLPEFPECVATGDTLGEVESEMRAAIALHLQAMAAGGDPVPDPYGLGVCVERNAPAAA